MAESPRLAGLFSLAYDAIRLLRDGAITADDLVAIQAVLNARIAVARAEETDDAGR